MDLSHIRFDAPRRAPQVRTRIRSSASVSHPVSHDEELCAGGLPHDVLARAGLDPSAYRARALQRRVSACLRALRSESETAASQQLGHEPWLTQVALGQLIIGVSSFFRDTDVFDAIETRVIPDLAARSGPIRVLSVGCSLGAELYSVAMLLDEAQVLDRSSLIGVDCRDEAIAAARAGAFPAAAVEGLTPERLARHFEATRHGWTLAAHLRARAEWRVADATRHIPHGPFDVVLCRNLLMYLRAAAADTLCRRLAASLTPGGYLVLGKAERPPASLPLRPIVRSLYYVDVS
jgi:chemotaxis methyl-accepting protein methylase